MALGTPQEALTTLQQVLPISHELSDRHLEESVLTNIARSYLQLGEAQHALDYGMQALAIQKQILGAAILLGRIHAPGRVEIGRKEAKNPEFRSQNVERRVAPSFF
jgi:tetratricopeptide (TPR) repeat protein